MSDEAENAATVEVVEQFKAASAAKAALEAQMKSLGDDWSELARALQHPDAYVFDADSTDSITVGNPDEQLRRPVVRVTPAEIDWDRLRGTLLRYNKAKQDRAQGIARLRAMGLPIAEE